MKNRGNGSAHFSGALAVMGPAMNRINEVADQRDRLRGQVRAVQALCESWDTNAPNASLAQMVLALLADADLGPSQKGK